MNCYRIPAHALALLTLLWATNASAFEPLPGFDPLGRGPGYPAKADGRGEGKPSLQAQRNGNGSILIDGRLDEAGWLAAPAATGFTQFSPERLGEACEETVFKVIYDDDAIYFGVACYRRNGEPITSCLSRRDQITSSDRIRVYIDPYHDLTTGYHFRINPDGVLEDYYNYDDLNHDGSWNCVWEAETYRDENGWYAEMRIPFSSIRYRAAESMTWGFNVFQYIHSRGERTAWSNWEVDQEGFMSRSGTITGIEGIRPPRQLEITPYMVGSMTDPSDPSASGYYHEDWDNVGNLGVDLKYGVTADLTLNATIQPDFGQVEADPSELNLSPFETVYQERRPFFVEGAQFFWHPNFMVFYSRRIGTGSANSRIRFAGKLTGKVKGDVSTAIMVAATDETEEGQSHNPFKVGDENTIYAIGRLGKQFNNGLYSFNLMQTAVLRNEADFAQPTRNGFVSGGDMRLLFRDRMWQATASFVHSSIDPKPYEDGVGGFVEPEQFSGWGGRAEIKKASGDWRSAATIRWEGDQLDINDLGYSSSANHYAAQYWITRNFSDDGDGGFVREGNLHFRCYKSWIYADRTFMDPDNPDRELWSYDAWHDQLLSFTHDGWAGFSNFWSSYWGVDWSPETTNIYATRFDQRTGERGPLIKNPSSLSTWWGFNSDNRRDFGINMHLSANSDVEGGGGYYVGLNMDWVQTSRLNHDINLSYSKQHDDAQWFTNNETGGGIGGTSYIFAELDRRTWRATLRSSMLFDRNKSLELYVQPYFSIGEWSNPRELMTPDSYDLRSVDDLAISDYDFKFGEVNLNMVYRWEYRPGSTLYLVWAHSRFDSEQRYQNPAGYESAFGTEMLLHNEPENRFMVKISYWLPV